MLIFSYIFLIIGGLFFMLGGLGTLRMPDSFNRIQAGTKATSLGVLSTMVGVAFQHPEWTEKIIIIIIFVLVSNPVGSSTIAKATHSTNAYPENMVVDEYKKEANK